MTDEPISRRPSRKVPTLKSGRPRGLNPMQARFAREFALEPSSARGAAIRAGYSPASAKDVVKYLQHDPRVLEVVDQVNELAIKDMALTKERVLQELCLIAFANLKDYITEDKDGNTQIDLAALSRDGAAPLVEVSVDNIKTGKTLIKKVKVKQADKMAALDKLGKHLGLFNDKLEVTGQVSLIDLITASMKKAIEDSQSVH